MSLTEFLSYLRTLDVQVWVDGGQLRVNAPKGVLTPALRQSLAERKAEILVFLSQAKEATAGSTIKPSPRTEPLPLSFAQQRLWMLHQFNPEDPSYHLPFALRIKGVLNTAVLQQCFDEIVRRHESLRTTFAAAGETITQIIALPQPLKVTQIDLQSLPVTEQEASLRRIVAEEARRPFDLGQGPLLRMSLIQLAEQEHVVALTIHHIVSDGWSLGVFARELVTLYEAFAAGKPHPEGTRLPELPIQYADFAIWQRQWLAQGTPHSALNSQLAYWKKQLAGAPAKLALPTDRPRPPIQTFNGARYIRVFPQPLTASIHELRQREEATLFMVLLAVFQTLLVRYTGQDDVVVGTATAGRELAELTGLIGYFANTLPLRTDLSGNPTFREALQRVRRTCLDAYAHQDVPFDRLVKELSADRDPSYAPIFQVLLVLQNAATDVIDLPGLNISYLEAHGGAARFDLSLDFVETAGGLHCTFEYNTDLFETATIARLADHFQALLEDVAAQPDRRLSDLALLTEADLQQLAIWNSTQVDYSHDRCIHQLFEAQVERTPDAVAVVLDSRQLTYRALNDRANCLAHRLQALGVQADVLVGLCVDRSQDLLVGVLGILKAGGAYVPLDPTYPANRLQFMVADAQVSVVLTQSHLVGQLPDLRNNRTGAQRSSAPIVVCLDSDPDILGSAHVGNPITRSTPDNLAYVIYTSGSTGRPKGVQIAHRAVVNFLQAMQQRPGLCPRDRLLAVTTLSFDIAGLELFLPLIVGAQVVIASREMASDGLQLANLLADGGITVMQATPATWRMLLHAGWQGQPGLKILCGGEALPRLLANQLLSRGASLWNMYGPTETTIWSAVAQVREAAGDVPIGTPIANTQLYVLDRQMQRVPVGVPGELYIGGDGLARGYLNRPDLTAERFIPDPFGVVPGARLYRVGDLMRYRADGTLEFLGRVDHQVKVRGYRIETGEIESVLNQHLAVREAVVMARQDTTNETRLVAYIVARTAADSMSLDLGALTSEIRSDLHERLPEYMVPARFVFLDALPLTPNGKVDRGALPEPDTSRPELEAAFVAPQTTAEQTLVNIWKQVLGLEQVGIHDNFFALGGDSILSFQIIARAAEAGYNLTAAQIFQHRTIAQLATVMSVRERVDAEQGLVTGVVPLTPIQRWFFELEQPELHHWNQSVMLDLVQPLDCALLEQTLHRLVQHHDALRLRFTRSSDGWQQRSAEDQEHSLLTAIDLSAMPASDQAAAISAQAAALQSSFDLEHGPLLQAAYFDLGPAGARLMLVIHHLAVDGFSWRVLLADLHTVYQQHQLDAAVALPAKTTAFKQWSEQLQTWAQTTELRAEQEFWLARPWEQIAPIPVDRGVDASANLESSRRTVSITLSPDQTHRLLQEVPQAYNVQIVDLVLTAIVEAFARWTGARTLLVDLEGHGREDLFTDVDLSRTVGWFTVLFPVVLDTRAANGPDATIKAVKEQLRQIPRHGIGYGLLRYLSDDPDLRARFAALPQAQILFNYLGQFYQALPDDSPFTLAHDENPVDHSPRNRRTHPLGINCLVVNGCMRLDWFYSEQIHDPATIERVAQASLQALQTLIAHCLTSENRGDTPSDFPLAAVDQAQLDRITSERRIADLYPLSSMQQGMLFHTISAPSSGVYIQQMTCDLHGNPDIEAFKRAWQYVVQQHAILRTSFIWEQIPQPLQVVEAQVTIPITQMDWRHLPPVQQDREREAYIKADRERGFDLCTPPLLRLALIRLTDTTYRFVWTNHHIILDGWSMPMIFRQVLTTYHAFTMQRDAQIEISRPYRDYIAWLQRQDLAAAESFWRSTLHGFSAPTPLGLDRRADSSDPAGRVQKLLLSTATTAALQAFARQHAVTLNTIVQGMWALLLSRYSRETDLVFGATVAGRPADLAGSGSMAGLFINTLPVRVQVDPDALLIPWLQQLQARQVEQRRYEYSPLVDVQGWSDVPRGMPLFESIVVFENYPIDASLPNLGGDLKIEAVQISDQTNYPLTIAAQPGPELRIELAYAAGHFDDATIRRMLDHCTTLLTAIADDPNRRLYELPVMPQTELQQVVEEWNGPAVALPEQIGLHQLVEAQVARTPDAIAVVFEGDCLSYRELNDRANQLAHHLQSLGVKPESLVGVYMERTPELVVALLGVLKAGAAYVPLDPSYPAERIQWMLDDAGVVVVLTQAQLHAALPASPATIVALDADWPQIAAQPTTSPEAEVQSEHPAYVIYTSGSTGTPKGVLVPHRGVLNNLQWRQQQWPLTADDRALLNYSISFDPAVWNIFWPLSAGAQLVLVSADIRYDSAALVRTIAEQQITIFGASPSQHGVLLEEPGIAACTSLRYVVAGGEQLSGELQQRFQATLPAILCNAYGPTEATIDAAFWVCPRGAEPQPAPIGRPLPNVQLYVLDQQLEPVPIGVAGELYIGGAGLARGYHQRPELTATQFVPNPFAGCPSGMAPGAVGARLYKTGDLVRYRADGNLEFLGRIDQQVKLRGFRIELGEIEAVLAQHPAVRDAVVVVHTTSSGDQRLVGYVVGEQRTNEQTNKRTNEQTNNAADTDSFLAPGAAELRALLQARLPEYMVPSAFVRLQALPLTTSGKLDRRALPAPDLSRADGDDSFAAPRTPLEELIAGVWSAVLGVHPIGIYDNFFTLGGHSLLATQAVTRLRQVLERDLPLRLLFEAPTIAQFAARIMTQPAQVDLPLVPVPRDGRPLPLSFAQQRLWFLDQLEPGSSAYNLLTAVRLRGTLDLTALQRSLTAIVHRHESLRTTFTQCEQLGEPVQVIGLVVEVRLSVTSLDDLPQTEQQAALMQIVSDEAQRPFDLQQGPLLRAQIAQINPTEHVLLLTIHHIVTDGWSQSILVRELAALYQGLIHNQSATLPELPIQYTDYAVWQRHWLQGAVLEQQIGYWRQQLADLPPLDLPTDYPRPPVLSYHGAYMLLDIPAGLTADLHQISQQLSGTLFMTLLAAFQTLLARYSGQADIAVGTPIAGRVRPELEPLIGFFVNTLVLRTDLGSAPCFAELVARVRTTALDAYAHQDLPFEVIVERLQPQRDLSRTPLFQVMFALQNVPIAAIDLPDLTLEPIPAKSSTAQFDLSLTLIETAGGIQGQLEYRTDLFAAATIERMAAHYQTLLAAIVADPHGRIDRLPLLTETERQQVLEHGINQLPVTTEHCIHELIAAQAARQPEQIAVEWQDQRLTYCDLDRRANQLARHLQALGVGPEVIVGVCLERSPQMVVALLAVLKAGGAYLPLDPSYPQERLHVMLHDARATVLLTEAALLRPEGTRLAGGAAAVVCLDRDAERINRQPDSAPPTGVRPDHLMYVIYTSGSTGQPKGVMIAHRSLVNYIHVVREHYTVEPGDRLLQFASISFDASVEELFVPLTNGATLVLRSEEMLASPAAFAAACAEQEITVLSLPTAFWHVLVEASVNGHFALPASVRLVIMGGEQAALTRLREWQAQYGARTRLVNLYGPTETTIAATAEVVATAIPETQPDTTIGTSLGNVRAYVLDPAMQPVPHGVAGELYLGGAGLARGYLHRPAVTAERFVPDPFAQNPGARLYRTGDRVRVWGDGRLLFLGRIDQQVKLRGYRIELGEIEARLRQHPTVGDAVVVMREDGSVGGQPMQYLVAYLVADEKLSSSALRDHLKMQLPEYMVPSAFVQLPALPLTPSGKLDRQALPAPDLTRSDHDVPYVAPTTPTEELLATIWTTVLGRERIGLHENFFELGGHSLLATRVIAQVRSAFQVELPVMSLFEGPTVADMARQIEAAIHARRSLTIPPIHPTGVDRAPLSFFQYRFWMADQLDRGNPAFNMPTAVRLKGALDLQALEHSLTTIVKRQAALRTIFVGDPPVQVIQPVNPISLPVLDLQALAHTERERELRRLITEDAQRRFDLQTGPLLRCTVARLAEQEHVLLLTVHHIVSDGWSQGILVRELVTVYAAAVEQRAQDGSVDAPPVALPPLPIQYADYAIWEHQWLQGETIERLLDYWREQLVPEGDPMSPFLSLPTDYPRGETRTFAGDHQSLRLSAELSAQLYALSRAKSCTLFMTLLAAFKVLLWRVTGEVDIMIGTPSAGRVLAETENLIGLFLNMLPLRTRITPDQTFQALLSEVRAMTLGAYTHQYLPMTVLVEALSLPRDQRYNPLFQIGFNMLNAPDVQVELPGLTIEAVPPDNPGSKLDFTIYVQEAAGTIQFELSYNPDLFTAARMESLLVQFQTLLQAIVADPDQELTRLG